MRILHSSDLHGLWDFLFQFEDFDIWIDSGDFFPNQTRGDLSVEVPFQRACLAEYADRIKAWLGDRPLISVPGNHDFIDLVDELNPADGYDLTRGPVEIGGETFAGFREIPYIAGEWAGEVHDFQDVIDRTFDADPTILVTHTPPSQILDYSGHSYGCSALTGALSFRRHRIRHHFFGHIHQCGGMDEVQMGVHFYNGATYIRCIEIS